MAKVKICGITELRDALKAYELGADFVGFIFFRESPRKVEPEHARVIIEDLPRELPKVGLFLDQGIEEVRALGKRCHLDFLQLHGSETAEYCRSLKNDFRIIKTFRIKPSEKDFSGTEQLIEYEDIDYYLFDTHLEGMAGGTGVSFNWEALRGKAFKKPFFLAGGLTPANVKEAVNKVSPYAVDVASGVEKSPGKKDYKLLKEFIDNAKKI